MNIGSIQSQSGASGYMPKVTASSENNVSFLDSTSSSSTLNETNKTKSISSEELLKMLSENTNTPMSNISSNDLLSLLQNNLQSNNTNKSNNLMNNILSAYSNN